MIGSKRVVDQGHHSLSAIPN